MYNNTLLLSTVAISTISVISVILTTVYVKDINNKIDILMNDPNKHVESESDSGISYTEWLKNKITT